MGTRLSVCVGCKTDDRSKHQPHRNKHNGNKWFRKEKQQQHKPDRNYNEEPIPDVFADCVVGDAFLVQLYNEGLIMRHQTTYINSTMRIQNGYRLYLDEHTIETIHENPVLNICFFFDDYELEANNRNGFPREMHKSVCGHAVSHVRYAPVFPFPASSTPIGTTQSVPKIETVHQNLVDEMAKSSAIDQATQSPLVNHASLQYAASNQAGELERHLQSVAQPEINNDYQPLQETMAIDQNITVGSIAPRPPIYVCLRKPSSVRKSRLTKKKRPGPLHRTVQQRIGDRIQYIERRMLPPVRFNFDLFRLLTFRHCEVPERARHMFRLGIPLTTPNLLTLSTVPFRGPLFNRFRTNFTRTRRIEYTPPGPNRPSFDRNSSDLDEQRRYIEAQMQLSGLFNGQQDTSPCVIY